MSDPAAAAPGVAPRVRAVPWWLVLVVVAVAVGVRVWVLASPLGRVDSDEAVVGLMARDLLHGDVSVFFWGQAYGGATEPSLAALVFAIVGSSELALKVVPLASSVVAALLVRAAGRRAIGEPGATLAAVLSLVHPAVFVWWATKERGFYWVGAVLCLVVLLLALRIAGSDAPRAPDLVLLGASAGVAWYTTPQSAFVLVPLALWLAVRCRRAWRVAWIAAAAFVVGALPWIVWNATHGLDSLEQPMAAVQTTYAERLRLFFEQVLPAVLGARRSITGEWVLGWVGRGAYVVALLAFVRLVVGAIRSPLLRARVEPLLTVALAYPFLFAVPVTSYYVADARYGLFLLPVVLLLLARLATTRWRQLVVAGLALALSISGVAAIVDFGHDHPLSVDLAPPELDALRDVLEARGVEHLYADYWIAYRLTFVTDEEIVASPVDAVRDAEIRDEVDDARTTTYALFADTPRDAAFAAALREHDVAFHRREVDDLIVVYDLELPVRPQDLPDVWRA